MKNFQGFQKIFLMLVLFCFEEIFAQEKTLQDFLLLSREEAPNYQKSLEAYREQFITYNFITNINRIIILKNIESQTLILDSLQNISQKEAHFLSEWKGTVFSLTGVKNLELSQLQELVKMEVDAVYLGITSLNEQQAECLASWKIKYLFLNHLETLTPIAAQKLSQWQGERLSLNGLKELSQKTALELTLWQQGTTLCLDGLTHLTPETAKALSYWKARKRNRFGKALTLNGLQKLEVATCENLLLIDHLTLLSLDGLQEIDELTAKCLFQHMHGHLSLKGLKKLEASQALYIADGSCVLFLDGLTHLTPEVAQHLSRGGGYGLSLNGIRSLDLETAKHLFQFEGIILLLNGLEKLEPEVAKILCQWQGERLALNGLKQLSPESAKYLARWQYFEIYRQENGMFNMFLFLNGLESLESESAKYLSQWKGNTLFLNGLKTLEPKSAQYLASWSGRQFFFNGVTHLESESAKHFVNWEGGLYLNALKHLAPETAKYLFARKYGLHLDSLESLSLEVSQYLHDHLPIALSLNGLKELTPEVAKNLFHNKGYRLYLNGLKTLSPEVAKYIANWQGNFFTLDGLESLSKETAEILSTWKSENYLHLSLKGLISLKKEELKPLFFRWKNTVELSLDGLIYLEPDAFNFLDRNYNYTITNKIVLPLFLYKKLTFYKESLRPFPSESLLKKYPERPWEYRNGGVTEASPEDLKKAFLDLTNEIKKWGIENQKWIDLVQNENSTFYETKNFSMFSFNELYYAGQHSFVSAYLVEEFRIQYDFYVPISIADVLKTKEFYQEENQKKVLKGESRVALRLIVNAFFGMECVVLGSEQDDTKEVRLTTLNLLQEIFCLYAQRYHASSAEKETLQVTIQEKVQQVRETVRGKVFLEQIPLGEF